ncbi:MAG: hypothetical protein JO242_00865, partial [Streptosporangiaceae bacterium]|nr:hypothetical protein [Streptosporangiaceae bacterium]
TVDLRLTEAEPPEALRMLRAGYVDVALVFRHTAAEGSEAALDPAAGLPGNARGRAHGDAPPAAGGPSGDADGIREQVLLDEPVHLVVAAHARHDSVLAPGLTELWPADLTRFAGHRWIAGCDRCREHLLSQCALAGFTPRIAFTTDDFVAVQALVKAGLGVAMLPALALRAARNPGVRTVRLRGTRRCVLAARYGEPPDPPATALLMEVLRAAAEAVPRPHDTPHTPPGGCAGKAGQLHSAP